MRSLTAIALAAGIILLAAPAAQADVIHACVNKKGSMRVVSDPGQCKPSESPLSWNQQGEPGEPALDHTTIQAQIDACAGGDCEVQLACETYTIGNETNFASILVRSTRVLGLTQFTESVETEALLGGF